DHTVITVGGDITKNIVTNTSVTLPVTFNVADGAFLGTQQLTEWVVGSRPGAPGQPAIIEPVEGATMTLTVTGGCGYFVTDPPGFSRTLVTTSRDGRVPFAISVDNDTGCIPGNAVHVTIVASYPPGVQGAPIAPETVDIIVQFTANSTRPPLLRWVGQ